MRRESRRRGADHGGIVVEYAALFVLLGILAAAITATTIGRDLGERIQWAVCTVLSLGEECELEDVIEEVTPGEDGEDPEDFVPDLCERGAAHEASSFNVQVIATFDSETSITRIERADGSVWFTAHPANRSVGGEVGVGARVRGGDAVDLNAGGEAAGSYDFAEGQIWTFDEDELDEADAFEEQLQEESSISSNPVTALWDATFGDDPELPEPDMELDISGGSGEISGGIYTGLNIGDLDGAGTQVDLGSGVTGGLDGAYENIVRTNHDDDRGTIISETNQIHGGFDVDGDVLLGGGGEYEHGWTAGIREDRNEDGDLEGIMLNATFDTDLSANFDLPFGLEQGSGHNMGPDVGAEGDIHHTLQQTHVYLEFDDDEERQTGEEFLNDYSGASGAGSYFLETVFDDHGFATEDPGPDGDPWEQLVYESAEVWQTQHDRDQEAFEVGASGRVAIFGLGGGYGTEEYEQETTDAWYLDAPEDGTREEVRHDDCIPD